MPTIVDVLRSEPKEIRTEWLFEHERPRFNRNAFFGSRTIYYPGSGDDGQPVKLCALSHVAHAFVYVDQRICWNTVAELLADQDRGFLGYKPIHDENVSKIQLRPSEWTQHIKQEEAKRSSFFQTSFVNPFARFVVLERQVDGEEHGPWRLAILFIGGDGFASFDALYCQEDDVPPPFSYSNSRSRIAGGNYDRFGRSGLLERIACRTGVLPKFLLVADCSNPWFGLYGHWGRCRTWRIRSPKTPISPKLKYLFLANGVPNRVKGRHLPKKPSSVRIILISSESTYNRNRLKCSTK